MTNLPQAPRAKAVLIPIAVIIGLAAAALWIGSRHEAPHDHALTVGSTFPDIELSKIGGGSQRLSTIPGKLFFLNFWALWCQPCVEEMPSIQKLHDDFKDKGLAIVAIDMDEDPEKSVARAQDQLGLSLPFFADRNETLSNQFNIEALPLTLILDKNRKILMIENNGRDWNGSDVRAQIETWLRGPS